MPMHTFLREKYSTQPTRPPAVNLFFVVRFKQLAPCFILLNTFVRWREGAQASLAHAWSASLGLFQGLFQLGQQGNEHPVRCSHASSNRLTETAELFRLILGYLIRREWLAWHR
jgi:hypothetical protein